MTSFGAWQDVLGVFLEELSGTNGIIWKVLGGTVGCEVQEDD